MKYTEEETKGIVQKITNILNVRAINAKMSKNLQVKDVKLDEYRRENV